MILFSESPGGGIPGRGGHLLDDVVDRDGDLDELLHDAEDRPLGDRQPEVQHLWEGGGGVEGGGADFFGGGVDRRGVSEDFMGYRKRG